MLVFGIRSLQPTGYLLGRPIRFEFQRARVVPGIRKGVATSRGGAYVHAS
jgi:hypothetical protein